MTKWVNIYRDPIHTGGLLSSAEEAEALGNAQSERYVQTIQIEIDDARLDASAVPVGEEKL